MSSEAVKVVVRVRPINEKERLSVCKIAVEVDEKNNSMQLNKIGFINYIYIYVIGDPEA